NLLVPAAHHLGNSPTISTMRENVVIAVANCGRDGDAAGLVVCCPCEGRREMVRLLAMVGGMAAALALTAAQMEKAAAQDRVTFAGYGGEPQKVQAKAFFEPASKELGVQVLQDSHGGYAKIKAQVLSGSPSFDIVALGCAEGARAAKEGLLEPLDYA